MNVEFLLSTSEKLDQSASHLENILQLGQCGFGVRLTAKFRTKTPDEEDAESEELLQVIVVHCGILEEFLDEVFSFLRALLFTMCDEKKKILPRIPITILHEDHRLDIFVVDSCCPTEDKGEDIDVSDILEDAIVDEFSDLHVGQLLFDIRRQIE